MRCSLKLCLAIFLTVFIGNSTSAQSLNFPSKDYGISIGNSKNFTGLRLNFSGFNFGGFGVGAGNQIKGITICGFGAGAPYIKGITLAAGMIKIENNGEITGLCASAFNYIKGSQNGISIGIVNYAHHLNGIQIGLINYVKDNPRGLKLLPIINFHID